ncbi:MAG: DUF5666 domain-containing protein [Bryobacteraceae bacterium]
MQPVLRNVTIIAAAAGLVFAVGALRAQSERRSAEVEIEGFPTQIDSKAGTFVIANPTKVEGTASRPQFSVATTDRTEYEDRNGKEVDRASFFSKLSEKVKVEVEGRLKENTLVADEVQIED